MVVGSAGWDMGYQRKVGSSYFTICCMLEWLLHREVSQYFILKRFLAGFLNEWLPQKYERFFHW
jgi:hypothetical protein